MKLLATMCRQGAVSSALRSDLLLTPPMKLRLLTNTFTLLGT